MTDDRQQAAQERARELQTGGSTVTAAALLQSPYWLIGGVDEMIERLMQLRATHDISYVVVREDAFEAFAPVVARLAGSERNITDKTSRKALRVLQLHRHIALSMSSRRLKVPGEHVICDLKHTESRWKPGTMKALRREKHHAVTERHQQYRAVAS